MFSAIWLPQFAVGGVVDMATHNLRLRPRHRRSPKRPSLFLRDDGALQSGHTGGRQVREGIVGWFNVLTALLSSVPRRQEIVTPNTGQAHSWRGSDLRAEPTVGQAFLRSRNARYYVEQWIDLFTQNFAYIGVDDRLRCWK